MELTNGNSALTPHERTTYHTQTRGTAARGLNKVLSVSRVQCSINKFNSEDEECQRTGRQYASMFNFTHEPSHTRLSVSKVFIRHGSVTVLMNSTRGLIHSGSIGAVTGWFKCRQFLNHI